MDETSNFSPELLLPVGNVEAFHAAMKGGANAIYLGLRGFNARNRATNFTAWQLGAIVKEAHAKNVKVYVTLNTVIRNNEIDDLVNTLFVLSQIMPDAIIVQDWGVFFIIRKFFPKLKVHASTQMANHNSIGINHAYKLGFERVVVARELTKTELKQIAEKSKAEIELFIHGALCYSFSGQCLFSSFLGGASANRGRCAQPCRRNYFQNEKESYFFSLKDNQLIDHLSFIKSLKIDSLKVEGRIKPADYVYQVATAYRMALDNPSELEKAEGLLQTDLGREKTDYFYGKKVGEAITQAANTGLFLGKVSAFSNGEVTFNSSIRLEGNCRFRIRSKANDEQIVLKVDGITENNGQYVFKTTADKIQVDDEIYLAGLRMKFPGKLNTSGIKIRERIKPERLRTIKSNLKHKSKKTRPEYYLRVDSLAWLRKIRLEDYNYIILNLTRKDWVDFNPKLPFIQKNRQRIFIELPLFIAEGDIAFYEKQVKRMTVSGLKQFSLNHLSQKEILPQGTSFITNEYVYTFNDAAIRFLKNEGASRYILPVENDIVNMANCSDKSGIVPVYFYPHLFSSRMPVKLKNEECFADKTGERFRKIVREGITIVLPEHPVVWTQYRSKLERYGYNRFLIDLSSTSPSKNTPRSVLNRLKKSEQIQPGTNFNFKRELK